MHKNVEEKTLDEMLMYSGISKLPPANDESKVWVVAIVKLLRRNGLYDYAVAEHDYSSWREIRIRKESAGSVPPVELIEIYPFEYIKPTDLPLINDRTDIVRFVSSATGLSLSYVSGLDSSKLQHMFYNIIIKNKMAKIKIGKNDLKPYEEDFVLAGDKSRPTPQADDVEEEETILDEEPKKRGRKPKNT